MVKNKFKYFNFVLGNVLSNVVYGYKCYKKEIKVYKTLFTYDVLYFLYKKGFIYSFKTYNDKFFIVNLKKENNLMNKIYFLSKSNKRIYNTVNKLKKNKFQKGFYIISTSCGLKTTFESKFLNSGGEILCHFK